MTDYGFTHGKVVDAGGGGASGIVKLIGLAFIALLVLIFAFSSFTTVHNGYVGVLSLYGAVDTSQVLPAGFHFINPLKSVHEINVQTREMKESASVPSNEGLIINLDTSLRYHIDAARAAEIYKTVQGDVETTIIEPALRSDIREVTSSHTANALYSGERDKVTSEIFDRETANLSARGIVVERVFLRDIALPLSLKDAIEQKQRAEQESLAMSFRLQKEKQEADRKRIEAEGIRDFSRTVASGISPELLTWKGIETTEKLSSSPNAKIVIIGNSKNGLPLVMGGQ
jgi:regulator of protease activity HflC (stomatin/prohibitin superfamily)